MACRTDGPERHLRNCILHGWPELKSATPPEDSNNDGMPDEWQVRYGLDPHSVDEGPEPTENLFVDAVSFPHLRLDGAQLIQAPLEPLGGCPLGAQEVPGPLCFQLSLRQLLLDPDGFPAGVYNQIVKN